MIEIILAAVFISGLIYWSIANDMHERHMRQILDAMEKERKLYQIISDKVQYDFQKAIKEGKIQILPDDDRSNN